MLFEECFNLIKEKEHLNEIGFNKILGLKYNLNKGLNEELKETFSNIIPIKRPKYNFSSITDPNWVSGFVTGDGGFDVRITQQSSNSIGYRVQLRFRISLIKKYKMYIALAVRTSYF